MSMTRADRGLAVEIEQEFAAASERVFGYWTDADALARWFAPGDYTTVVAAADARPGGAWSLEFRAGDGRAYTERGSFLELDDVGTPDSPRTRMRFRQTGHANASLRDQNAEGWRGCFAKLEDALT